MADHIYKNQPWTVYLDTETTLTGATLKIRLRKPSGTIVLIDATESSVAGEIYAKITGTVNNEAGRWEIRPWVLFSGDTNYTPGKPYYQKVEDVLT